MANVPPQGGRKHPHQEFYQVDTTNILFICGGAFVGLEDIIAKRVGRKTMGFKADVVSARSHRKSDLLELVQPEDLIKFGFIPEFIGRLPVVATLEELQRPALIQILTEPKNALLTQYQKIFEFENVKLRFTDDAVEAIADLALARKVGARGLRCIMEEFMLDVMYSLPSRGGVSECLITSDVVKSRSEPVMLMEKAG